MNKRIDDALKEIEDLLEFYDALPYRAGPGRTRSRDSKYHAVRMEASIIRHTRPDSPYRSQPPVGITRTDHFATMLEALARDLAKGYHGLSELVHADTFSTMLDMADHLLEGGYKDPAAVIAGATLEAHLRNLCIAHSIENVDANAKHVKTAHLNDALVKLDVYSSMEHKQVIAWLGLRNEAAHGHFEKYDSSQVRLMSDGIRGFIERYPA